MTGAKHPTGYVPNAAYTQEDCDEVSDNPDITDEELAGLRPAREGLPPQIYAALVNKGGRPKSAAPKVSITIRLDRAVVDAYKSTGPGWQTRNNEALARASASIGSDDLDGA